MQHDNDLKHSTKSATEWRKKKIKDVAKALSESRPQPDSKAEVGPLESCE